MRIHRLDERPMEWIRFLNASSRGTAEVTSLPIVSGRVDGLPPGLEAILVTSDLQGVTSDRALGGQSRLLGEELAEVYAFLADEGHVPPCSATGVVLAGDLYSCADGRERGATGDVRSVWNAFADVFRWVAGVAGNHDLFGTARERARLEARAGLHLLDGRVAALDGLRVGGVGFIAGNPGKPGRRSEDEQLALIEQVLVESPDVLVLHEGPSGSPSQRGSAAVRDVLTAFGAPLTICGHRRWSEPLLSLEGGGQVLNVDERAVVLTATG
jgi:3',5'-cyclic-AMP phosphodiesterase